MMQITSSKERPHLFSISFAVSLAAGIFGNIVAGNLPVFLIQKGFNVVYGYRISLIFIFLFLCCH